jgi:hypothetical protein
VLWLAGCGGSSATPGRGASRTASPVPRGPAFGLTEDNANLLSPPDSGPAAGVATFQRARERLSALHPSFVRLLVDWAALQPQRDSPPSLERRVDGCARSVGPCAAYGGIRDELRAIAAQQRAARAEGRPEPQVVLDLFGVPEWAARAPGGCELAGTRPFSRPINAGGLDGYRALIGSLLALGAREGVALEWWAPWNEPNDSVFVSPQRASCASDESLAPAVYTELAQAAAEQLAAAGGLHHLLLGELNGFATDSPHHTSIASFVAGLPESVVCLSDTWSVHAYASRVGAREGGDPVDLLEEALDAHGACGRRARVWVTEAGTGAPHPGRPRPADAADQLEGCETLAQQLARWSEDPRVEVVLQYSFREDPAFPVGLLSPDLSRAYPAYRLWLSYARASAQGRLQVTPRARCA